MSENRLLEKMFIPRRDEVAGGWKNLRNEKLHNAYSSPPDITITPRIRNTHGEMRSACKILVENCES